MTDQGAYRAQVYRIVRSIPRGRVMTYGDIGAQIPPPEGMDGGAYEKVRARWVGYAMRDCPEELPWHRVVNAQGRISRRPGLGPQIQRSLLESEGVEFTGEDRFKLARYRWDPSMGDPR